MKIAAGGSAMTRSEFIDRYYADEAGNKLVNFTFLGALIVVLFTWSWITDQINQWGIPWLTEICKHPWALFFVYVVLYGAVTTWIKKRRGLATGMVCASCSTSLVGTLGPIAIATGNCGKCGRNAFDDTTADLPNRTGPVSSPTIENRPADTSADRLNSRTDSWESGAIMESGPGRFVVRLPPRGMTKAAGGLVGWSCIWCGILIFGAINVLAGPAAQQMPQGFWGKAKSFAGLVPFFAPGVAGFLLAAQLGRNRAEIVIEDGQLNIDKTGVFGTRRYSYPAEALAEVYAATSGSINRRPVYKLQIETFSGNKAGFFRDRDGKEVKWLVDQLRRELNMKSFET
jgi:hypothetical protein